MTHAGGVKMVEASSPGRWFPTRITRDLPIAD